VMMPGPRVGVGEGAAVRTGVRLGLGVREGRSVAVGAMTVPLVRAGSGLVALRIINF